jgi:CheY-like chemotaxis protein
MILIADDSSEMRKALKDILQELNESVYECSDGVEAVEMYGRVHPKWVLMDVKMPVMDGIAATRKIKLKFPNARVVIVTNYDDPILRQEAKEAGAIAFIKKDDLSVLETILRKQS